MWFAPVLFFLVLLLHPMLLLAQDSTTAGRSGSAPIQDNSFLVEEAYNQEDGVVQHISSFERLTNSHDWVYTQTDEWPLRSLRHQVSITLAGTHSGSFAGSGAGWGDTALNYRYQLLGSGETKFAIAPRVSVLLPSGDHRYGRGSGGLGMQMNLRGLTELYRLCRVTTMRNGPQLTTQTLKVLGTLLNNRPDALSGADIGRATRLQSGTLYPILLRLEQAGWVESYWESETPQELGRPRRRFYQLTAIGTRTAKTGIRDLASTIGGLAWRRR